MVTVPSWALPTASDCNNWYVIILGEVDTASPFFMSVINIHMNEKQVQDLIDKAIDKHNKTATLISAALGSVLLFFYADGLFRMIERVS